MYNLNISYDEMVLAHGIAVRFREKFDRVFEALTSIDEASNVYVETLDTEPKTALAVGEKYFFRAENYLTVTVLLLENGDSTIVKAIASGSRAGLFDVFDLGACKDYTHIVVNEISRILGKDFEVIGEVDYLDRSKSGILHTRVPGGVEEN